MFFSPLQCRFGLKDPEIFLWGITLQPTFHQHAGEWLMTEFTCMGKLFLEVRVDLKELLCCDL